MSVKTQSFIIGSQKIGNWDWVNAKLKKLPFTVNEEIRLAEKAIGNKVINLVKSHLINQDLPWAPLKNPENKNNPASRGLILVDTEFYLKHIVTWQKNGVRYVGVKKDIMGKDGFPLWERALVLEYGSMLRGIVERPLWRKVWEQDLQNGKEIRNTAFRYIRNRLKKEGYNPNFKY